MAAGAFQAIQPYDQVIYDRGTIELPEKASGVWKAGAICILNGGYVEEAGTAPSTVKYIAFEDGHNGGSDGTYNGRFWPITADVLWEISFLEAIAVANNGGNFGVVKDATTKHWYLSTADTGDQMTLEGVVQTPDLGAIGDTKARVLARFQTANIAGA